MYHLEDVRKKIQEYEAKGNYLFYKIKGENYSLFLNDVLIDEKNEGFFFFKDYYGLNHQDSTEFVKFSSNEKITIPVTFIGNNFFNNTFVISKNSIREDIGLYSSNYVICQLFPFKELYELPDRYYGSGYRFGNRYIQNNKKVVQSLSLLTGEYEWELDLEEKLGKYDKIGVIFGVVDAILWLVSQRGILFGIDVNTGILVHHLNYDNVLSFQETGLVNSKYFHSLFDEKAKKLVGIYQKTYWEIDLLNPKNGLKVIDLPTLNIDYFADTWANPQGMVFDESYIYFRDIEISTVGVLSRQTQKIVWHQRINDLEPRPSIIINNIQITETNLYVLDTGGTLHIFEREEE